MKRIGMAGRNMGDLGVYVSHLYFTLKLPLTNLWKVST